MAQQIELVLSIASRKGSDLQLVLTKQISTTSRARSTTYPRLFVGFFKVFALLQQPASEPVIRFRQLPHAISERIDNQVLLSKRVGIAGSRALNATRRFKRVAKVLVVNSEIDRCSSTRQRC